MVSLVFSIYSGTAASGYLNGTIDKALFYAPLGVYFNKQWEMYVLEDQFSRIRKITKEGMVSSFVTANLQSPKSLAIDDSNNVYVANYGTNSVIKITSSKK